MRDRWGHLSGLQHHLESASPYWSPGPDNIFSLIFEKRTGSCWHSAQLQRPNQHSIRKVNLSFTQARKVWEKQGLCCDSAPFKSHEVLILLSVSKAQHPAPPLKLCVCFKGLKGWSPWQPSRKNGYQGQLKLMTIQPLRTKPRDPTEPNTQTRNFL